MTEQEWTEQAREHGISDPIPGFWSVPTADISGRRIHLSPPPTREELDESRAFFD